MGVPKNLLQFSGMLWPNVPANRFCDCSLCRLPGRISFLCIGSFAAALESSYGLEKNVAASVAVFFCYRVGFVYTALLFGIASSATVFASRADAVSSASARRAELARCENECTLCACARRAELARGQIRGKRFGQAECTLGVFAD